MSDFLRKMYEEEMSKTGSAEFRSLMSALPKEDLESYLGIKVAAEQAPADDERRKMKPNAPAKPEAKHQDEEPETNLDKKAARVRAIMDKLAVGGPAAPPLPDSEKGQLKVKQDKIHNDVNAGNPQKETVPVDHQGPGKEAVEVERDGKKITTTKEAMVWADNMGRSIVASMVKAAEDEASAELAQEKAKIAMMALRTSLHAPEQIKQASIKFAGKRMAEQSTRDPDWYDRMIQYQQAMNESKGLNVGLGGLSGALLGGLAASRASGGKGLHTALGALGGGVLGGGVGYLGSRLAAKNRRALQGMGRGE